MWNAIIFKEWIILNIMKETYRLRIGPDLKQCLDRQLKSIKEVTYGKVKSSYYEAGEILAKKINENRII